MQQQRTPLHIQAAQQRAASGSLVAATTTAAAMDGRMDGSDGRPVGLGGAGEHSEGVAESEPDLVSRFRARQSERSHRAQPVESTAISGAQLRTK